MYIPQYNIIRKLLGVQKANAKRIRYLKFKIFDNEYTKKSSIYINKSTFVVTKPLYFILMDYNEPIEVSKAYIFTG